MTAVSEVYHEKKREPQKGYLQFEVGEKIASEVLGRIMQPRAYDVFRRRYGGFFVTVPRPMPYVFDGMTSTKSADEVTYRQRLREVHDKSFQNWPQSIGPTVAKLAVLYPKSNESGSPSSVALATVLDEESYKKIENMIGEPEDERDYQHIDLVPRIILPVGTLAVGEAFRGFKHGALTTLQYAVKSFNDNAHEDLHRLRVPPRFVPDPRSTRRG